MRTVAIICIAFILISIVDKLDRINHSLQSQSFEIIALDSITITYYTDDPAENEGKSPVLTASNDVPMKGTVAISRDLKRKYNVEFGDVVYIENKGFYIINNLMRENKKNRFDVFTKSKETATSNGKHKSRCWLIKKK